MRFRFFLVSYLVVNMGIVGAAPTNWNCGQVADKGHWQCTSPDASAVQEGSATETRVPFTPKTNKLTPSQAISTPSKTQPPVILPSVPQAPAAMATDVNSKQVSPPPKLAAPSAPPEAKTLATPPEVAANSEDCCNNQSTNAEETETSWSLLQPTFKHSEEQIFNRMQARLRANPWQQCESSFTAPNPFDTLTSNKSLRDTTPTNIEANYAEVFEKEIYGFSGDVKIKRADQDVLADKVMVNNFSDTVDAQGNVYYTDDDLSMFSDSVLLKLDSNQARLRDTLFISPGAPIRGSASTVYQETKTFSHYKDVSYTSCPPGNQDWIIHASRLKMNKDSGIAAAKNAWLEFKGLPLFYTPFISFPMDNRRITGLLTPHFAISGENGFDGTLPFYWNIAPNYDLLFRPRFLAKRGVMLGADFRYMNSISQSKLSLDVLPYDDRRNGQTRYQAHFDNQTILGPHTNTNIDLNYVSDKRYISELRNALGFTDIRHIRSIADLNYNREGVNFLTRMENYQTIDQSIPANQRPYRKLPQVMLNLNHAFEQLPLPVKVGLDNEFVFFAHSHTQDDNAGFRNVDGERFNINPYVSLPFKNASGFAVPKFSFLYTQYLLNNQFDRFPGSPSTSSLPDDISRTLPIASFDTGLFAETELNFNNSSYIHTLEPRLFYVYIPYVDQTAQPVFDTAVYDFNFDSLFRENSFTGIDRVQNTNQLTLALTTRLLDANTGKERLKFSVGDIFYLENRRAMLDANDPNAFINVPAYYRGLLQRDNRHTFSNVVAELSGQVTDKLGFSSGIQWDPYHGEPIPCRLDSVAPDCVTKQIPRTQVALHYQPKPNQIVNVAYRYRQGLVSTADASFRWPLFANWFAVGRWQYSLLHDKTTESFLGLEKENCCWRFRIIGRRFINGLNLDSSNQTTSFGTLANSESQTTIMLQIELKSLSAFGDNVDAFLKRSIYGYN